MNRPGSFRKTALISLAVAIAAVFILPVITIWRDEHGKR